MPCELRVLLDEVSHTSVMLSLDMQVGSPSLGGNLPTTESAV